MKCPYCGRDVIYSDRFCKCGHELDMVVCPNCGTPNISVATFCGNCGWNLADAQPYIPPEEPEEAAIPEQETEETAVPEQESEKAVSQETEEAVGPETEPEPVTEETPEPEPESEEAAEPEETSEPEPEPEVTPEPEEESEEVAGPETEPEEDYVVEQDDTPDEDYVPEEEYTPEEGFAAEQTPEPEEGVGLDQTGGRKRRRGGLIALLIVIIIVVVVVIILAVLFTHRNREENNEIQNTESLADTEEEQEEDLEKEEEEEETPATVSDVSFYRQTTSDNKQEYAVVTGTDDAGNAVWEYTTPKYDVAELDRVSKIGLHGTSYFLIQDGAVVSLDKATGEVLWENDEYGGVPVDHSWDYASGGLFLCGYEGPAIFGVSYDGETLGKIEEFDDLTEVTETNLWAYKVYVSGNEATVLYGPENVIKDADMAISEEEATTYTVDLDTWEYTLVSSGGAEKDNSGSTDNGGDSSGDNGGSSGSSGGSSDNSGGSSGGGSGSSGGDSSGGSSTSSGNGGSSGDSGSGSGSGGSSGGGNGGSSQAKFSMSDVKDVTASSYLYEKNVNISHDPKYLVDGSLKNAWCEDASGDGIGQWAKVTFNGTYTISGMNINAGYQKSESLYYENNRPKEITITFSDGSSFNTTLEDVNKQQTVSFSKSVNTSSVTITIRSVYKGSKYEDTCISEVAFY